MMVQVSSCGGFPHCGAHALPRHVAAVVTALAEFHRGMWDLSGSGITPASPALTGGLYH